MRPSLVFLAPLIAVSLAAPPEARGSRATEAIVARSRIERVTVYPDRASVQRLARDFRVGPGGSRVVFSDLPPSLIAESVRAWGEGSAGVRIANVDVKRTFLSEAPDARADSLRRTAKALDLERAKLLARKESHVWGEEFLKSIKVHEEEKASEAIARGSATPSDLKGVFEFLRTEFGENRSGMLDIDEAIARLDERIAAVRREIDFVRVARRPGVWTATVDLVSDSPATVDVALEYTVCGVSWTPAYDIRVSEDLTRIELVYFGQVSQQSGEEWDDVVVSLSTAEPALGVQVPTLDAWWLAPLPDLAYEFKHRAMNAPADAIANADGEMASEIGFAERDSRAEESAFRLASVEAQTAGSGMTARFDVPGRQRLVGDGTVRRLTVTTIALEGALSYRSVPRISPYAYLVAKVRNGSESPLLDGPTQVFLGTQFLGAGRIESAAPGQEFDVSLGVDKAVKVERTLARRERRASGRAGGEDRIELLYRTEIENHRKVPVEITLEEQFPVSQDRSIVVTEKRLSPAAAERSKEDGKITWTLTVAPDRKDVAEIGFEIRYPAGRPPMGLL